MNTIDKLHEQGIKLIGNVSNSNSLSLSKSTEQSVNGLELRLPRACVFTSKLELVDIVSGMTRWSFLAENSMGVRVPSSAPVIVEPQNKDFVLPVVNCNRNEIYLFSVAGGKVTAQQVEMLASFLYQASEAAKGTMFTVPVWANQRNSGVDKVLLFSQCEISDEIISTREMDEDFEVYCKAHPNIFRTAATDPEIVIADNHEVEFTITTNPISL